MNRYAKSFTITLLLYIAIFISFLYSSEEPQIKSSQTKSDQVVKFTIIQEAKPVVKKKEIIVKKKEIKKVIKKKVATKKIKPKIIEKKKQIIKKKKTTEIKKTIVKQQIKKNKSIQKITKNHQDTLKKHKYNQKKYYTKIKETINKNKSYPRVAVKRGIEGIVKINFTISKNGELLSFHIKEGKKIFQKSITKAVQNSFPLIPPKGLLDSNISLSLTINYYLY